VRQAVHDAAAQPKTLADFKKVAKDATKGDKAFADAIVDEMVAVGQLYEHRQETTLRPGQAPRRGTTSPKFLMPSWRQRRRRPSSRT
jgi:hypothetical protein